MTDGREWLASICSKFMEQSIGHNASLPFPWPSLSILSGGLRTGKLHLLVGPQGTGKTFFIMALAMAIHQTGKTWKYLPLEDSKEDYLLRLLAMLEKTYRIIDEDSHGAEDRNKALERNQDKLLDLEPHICPNPREDSGELIFSQDTALAWIAKNMDENRVLIIDPITQIEFGAEYKKSLAVEEGFIRDILGLAAKSKCSLVLVTHTKNRAGAKGKIPISVEDVQGSSLWPKLAQQIIMLDAHEEKPTLVHCKPAFPGDATTKMVESNRTVLIGKTRFGKGTRRRLAYYQDEEQPIFRELGVIAPKDKNG